MFHIIARLTALYPIQGGKADVHQLESFRPIDFTILSPNNVKANSSKVWQDIEHAAALEKEKQQEQEQIKGYGNTSQRNHNNKTVAKPQASDRKRPTQYHRHNDHMHQKPAHPSDHHEQQKAQHPSDDENKKVHHASGHAAQKPPHPADHVLPKAQHLSDQIHQKSYHDSDHEHQKGHHNSDHAPHKPPHPTDHMQSKTQHLSDHTHQKSPHHSDHQHPSVHAKKTHPTDLGDKNSNHHEGTKLKPHHGEGNPNYNHHDTHHGHKLSKQHIKHQKHQEIRTNNAHGIMHQKPAPHVDEHKQQKSKDIDHHQENELTHHNHQKHDHHKQLTNHRHLGHHKSPAPHHNTQGQQKSSHHTNYGYQHTDHGHQHQHSNQGHQHQHQHRNQHQHGHQGKLQPRAHESQPSKQNIGHKVNSDEHKQLKDHNYKETHHSENYHQKTTPHGEDNQDKVENKHMLHHHNHKDKKTTQPDEGHHKSINHKNIGDRKEAHNKGQKSVQRNGDGYQMQRHHEDQHQKLTHPKHQQLTSEDAQKDTKLAHITNKNKHGSQNHHQGHFYDDDYYTYNYHNEQEQPPIKDESYHVRKNKEQPLDSSAHQGNSFHDWHDYSMELEDIEGDKLLKFLTSQDHTERGGAKNNHKKGWIGEKEGQNNRDDIFNPPSFGNIFSSKYQAFEEDRSGKNQFNPYTLSESMAKLSRYHSGQHGQHPMTDWLNSKNVTTMLTAKQLNNRRVVLAKKTIQYFLLPQQFHHLIQTGQLTDVQSNLTTTEEKKILQEVVLSQHPLNMESRQHHHHHHHYHHHPNQGEPQSLFYKAFPFLQRLISGSARQRAHIPSDYTLQYQMPNTHQITAGEREGDFLLLP